MREFLNIKGDKLLEGMEDNLVCPFCGEKDFDKIGLKYHLQNYCNDYKNTEEI